MANKAIHCISNTLSGQRKQTNDQFQIVPFLQNRKESIGQIEWKIERIVKNDTERQREPKARARAQLAESLDRWMVKVESEKKTQRIPHKCNYGVRILFFTLFFPKKAVLEMCSILHGVLLFGCITKLCVWCCMECSVESCVRFSHLPLLDSIVGLMCTSA